MILAYGSFRAQDIVAAAVSMSCGKTADHDNKTVRHADGWGAVWRDAESGMLSSYRETRPVWAAAEANPLAGIVTDFLAIHVRNATLREKQGVRYAHPLARADDDWYFMHNGYMPTVYRLLGMESSEFDSAEYFSYLVPEGATGLSQEDALSKLRTVPAGGCTSGNAIAVHPGGAYVIHWSPDDTPTPRFFVLYQFSTSEVQVIASERIPALASRPDWREMTPRSVLALPFPPRRCSQ